jgi:prevent-host-death family protein
MNVESPRRMGLAEAKAHLSALITAVEAGESICLTRWSKPVATLSPVRATGSPRYAPAVPLDLAWLQRVTDAMPIGTADIDDLVRDLNLHAID